MDLSKNWLFKTLLEIWTIIYKAIVLLKEYIINIAGFKKTKLKSESQEKGIKDLPGPTSFPFFGTTLSSCELNPTNLKESNEVNFAKYGPIFKHEYFWNIPIVAISNPDDIETICTSSSLRPPMAIIAAYRALNIEKYHTLGIVSANGEEWQKLRKKATQHVLNTKFLNSLISGLNEIADDFCRNVSLKGPIFIDAADFFVTYPCEIAFYLYLGRRVGFITKDEEIPDHLKTFIANSYKYFQAFSKSTLGFPWWQYLPTKVWRNFVAAEDQLYSIVQRLADESKVEKKKVPGVRSLLYEQHLSPSEVQTLTLEFIMGTTDPVLQAIILTLYWISKHEKVQEKLHEELRSVLPNKDSAIDEECLNRLVYLQACIMESFRFSPTAPNVARITDSELKIQGYQLPAYTVVIGQSWHSYLQEENFYKAKEFIPERWLLNSDGGPMFQPHRKNIVRLFGGGKRICPGNKFAPLSVKILLAKLFRNFDVKFLEDLEIKYVFLVSAVNSVDIQFTEYED